MRFALTGVLALLVVSCGQDRTTLATDSCPTETRTGNVGAEAAAAASPGAALKLYLLGKQSTPTLPTDTAAYVERNGIAGHRLFFHRNGNRADYEVDVGPSTDGGWAVTSVSVC